MELDLNGELICLNSRKKIDLGFDTADYYRRIPMAYAEWNFDLNEIDFVEFEEKKLILGFLTQANYLPAGISMLIQISGNSSLNLVLYHHGKDTKSFCCWIFNSQAQGS